MSSDRPRVLGVGVATLDIINEVSAYPAEDDEVRALGQRRCRGGNVANSLVVLSALGCDCAWAGTLAGDAEGAEILRDLRSHGVDTGLCIRHSGGATPTSYVTLSRVGGSRTIVHHRDLAELTAADFAAVNLQGWDWVHFEGRNSVETAAMVRDCAARRPGLPVSLEVEKPRPGVDQLLQGPDVLLFSRVYVRACGFTDPERFLVDQWQRTDARLLVLAWGDGGAYAQARGGVVFHAPAYTPPQIRDTLGAGDVFNAAVIAGLLDGLELPALLARANRLAGYKCGRQGLDEVVEDARAAGLLQAAAPGYLLTD